MFAFLFPLLFSKSSFLLCIFHIPLVPVALIPWLHNVHIFHPHVDLFYIMTDSTLYVQSSVVLLLFPASGSFQSFSPHPPATFKVLPHFSPTPHLPTPLQFLLIKHSDYIERWKSRQDENGSRKYKEMKEDALSVKSFCHRIQLWPTPAFPSASSWDSGTQRRNSTTSDLSSCLAEVGIPQPLLSLSY